MSSKNKKWITNGEETIQIDESDLESYLYKGYRCGRASMQSHQTCVCAWCGKSFTPIRPGTFKYCEGPHYATCTVCGKQFEVHPEKGYEVRKTCSRSCTAKLRKQTCLDKYGSIAPAGNSEIQEKMKQTNLERYGTIAPMQNEHIKQKVKQTVFDKYGVENAFQSEELREKAKQTMIEKYRVEHPAQSKEIQNKMRRTSLECYGVENIFQSKEIRAQWQADYKQKTGYDHPFQNPEVQKKVEETNLKRYGVRRPLQNSEIKSKADNTLIEKYGYTFAHLMSNPEIAEKKHKTNLERWGTEEVFASPIIQEKIRNTNNEKYGTINYCSSKDYFLTWVPKEKHQIASEFYDDPDTFMKTHFDEPPSLLELQDYVGVKSGDPIHSVFNRHGLDIFDYVAFVLSTMEREVTEYLLSLDPSLKIERNTKLVITPLELDIYLPDYKFAIECDPTSTHNSSFNLFADGPSDIPYNYHMNKTNLCEERGIFLFHIFGYEWSHQQDVIKSMLRNILQKNERKLYARKLTIKEVSSSDASKFLDENHRQGKGASSVRLGLYNDNELVSLMIFGPMRYTIGTDYTDLSDCWELSRFCSVKNTTIVGGASKLFKYFINHYHPARIRSFSDRAHTSGNLYKMLGFHEVRRSDPGYVWVDKRTDKAYHRINAQKRNIKQFLHDDSIDLNLTEKQIMESHGYYQFFDCGTVLWERSF